MYESIYNYCEVWKFLAELEQRESLANGELNYIVENGKILYTYK